MSRLADGTATTPAAIAPPRPNLGPEPWSDPPGWGPALVPAAISLGFALILARWLLRRRRAAKADAVRGPSPAEAVVEVDPSPRRLLIASSESVRTALIAAFGPTWGSKTTEEVAADLAVVERLGSERAKALVGFLRLADRAKFAGDESLAAEGAMSWAAGFVEALTAEAAALASKKAGG